MRCGCWRRLWASEGDGGCGVDGGSVGGEGVGGGVASGGEAQAWLEPVEILRDTVVGRSGRVRVDDGEEVGAGQSAFGADPWLHCWDCEAVSQNL